MERVIDSVKPFVPFILRKKIKAAQQALKDFIVCRTGVLPDFLIIGAQKCGTTSLYEYLTQHPEIYPATVKEVGYFDRYYQKGLPWYRSQFPSAFHKLHARFILRRNFLTGEASTGYILNPHSLRRIAATVPRAKLILMLRNPVDRAYSHYQHTLRMKREPLSFEEAVRKEPERIADTWTRMLEDENYHNLDVARYAYLRTGLYIDQVRVLMSFFSKEQVLIIKNEDFDADPSSIVRQVLGFLGVEIRELLDDSRHNTGKYREMDPRVRKDLIDYFRPYNRQLYEFLGVNFDWENEELRCAARRFQR
jgi:Sulfotransferase domain